MMGVWSVGFSSLSGIIQATVWGAARRIVLGHGTPATVRPYLFFRPAAINSAYVVVQIVVGPGTSTG